MEQTLRITFSLKPDWKWVLVAYCYLIIFHLFPTFLFGGLSILSYVGSSLATYIWLYFGLALVAVFVGYKSKGVTLIEPVIAGAFYAVTLALGFNRLQGINVGSQKVLAQFFFGLLVLAISFAGALIGEVIQDWGKKRQEAAQKTP